MENKNIIGIRIKEMRLEKKLTQKDLAQRLGLKNDTAIANYEAGYSIPKDNIKIKLCKLFGCSMDYLMGTSNTKNVDIDLTDIRIAQHGGIDTNGLSEEDIEEIKRQVEYMKWRKKKGNK